MESLGIFANAKVDTLSGYAPEGCWRIRSSNGAILDEEETAAFEK
jgi:hypothetical protein